MMQFTTVDRVLSKLYRETRGTQLNESDVIEWIGEALDFMKVPNSQEQAVAFIEVKDYECDIPEGFQLVLQVARNNNWTKESKDNICPSTIIEEKEKSNQACSTCETNEANKAGYPVPLDCNGMPITDYEVAYYRPYFDLQWEYDPWRRSKFYEQNYTPVRLANHTLFKSLVCKEKEDLGYHNAPDEYTIVGTYDRKLRFSFKEGSIALSYLKTVIDRETGYPLVPDDISYITAITYYIKWKVAEWKSWNGRQGWESKAIDQERKWLKYVRQAKSEAKMPKGIDQYQNLLESSHYLVPRLRRYYGFFGKLGRAEERRFNDPDHRKKLSRYYYGG